MCLSESLYEGVLREIESVNRMDQYEDLLDSQAVGVLPCVRSQCWHWSGQWSRISIWQFANSL
jgi:hypothetical protein